MTRFLASRRASSIAVALACAARRSSRSRRARRRGPSRSDASASRRLPRYRRLRSFQVSGASAVSGSRGFVVSVVRGFGSWQRAHHPRPRCSSRRSALRAALIARSALRAALIAPRGASIGLHLQCRQDLLTEQRHVAGAHRDDDVTGSRGRGGNRIRDRREVGHVMHRHVTCSATLAPLTPAIGCSRAAYTSSTNTSSAPPSACAELPRECLCPGVQVRLEHHDRAGLARHHANGLECRAHLGRVVGVVVEDPHARRRADRLETASHALEPGQAVEHRLDTSAPTSMAASSAANALSAMCLPGTARRIPRGCGSPASRIVATLPVPCCSQFNRAPARFGSSPLP